MWIRSQDKMNLIEVQGFQICYIKNEHEEYWEIYTIGTSLGTYKSKERALEVLDEIDSKIMMNKVIEIYSNLGDLTFANRENYTYTPIYKMPKE